MKFLKAIKYIWQLPQNLLGVLWKNLKKESIITEVSNDDLRSVEAKGYLMMAGGAVTLGQYVFISHTYRDPSVTIKHECGHVKQSRILGPLYLIVIGIPSILHAWLNDYCNKSPNKYSHFFSEKWADKLMGI